MEHLIQPFGAAGIATANFGGADEANSVVIQDNGAILAVGTSLQGGQPLTAVAAFDAAGKLITSFGNNGLTTFTAPSSTTTTRELHIGDLVERAFGSSTTNGKLLVGSSISGTQTVFSSLRRLIVPGTTSGPSIKESLLGVFGNNINGKKVRLVVDLGSGRQAIFLLAGGTGTALRDEATDQIHLEITAGPKGAALTLMLRGGGTVSFSNIDVTGSLKSIRAPGATLTGTLNIVGSLGHATLGTLAGNVQVAGAITSLAAGALARNRFSQWKCRATQTRQYFGTCERDRKYQ